LCIRIRKNAVFLRVAYLDLPLVGLVRLVGFRIVHCGFWVGVGWFGFRPGLLLLI
jgi:hypothetical protein